MSKNVEICRYERYYLYSKIAGEFYFDGIFIENDDNTGAYFVIPSNTKILYIYSLKVSDIKNGKKI